MSLNVGGDDITEFLYVLLDRIHFSYRDCDLSRSYDWNVMEDLKIRLCTLQEVGIFPNQYIYQSSEKVGGCSSQSVRLRCPTTRYACQKVWSTGLR